MVKPIPVNPTLLIWARETAGLSINDVVESIKRNSVTSETVIAWEEGTDYPTYPQLKRLAYEVYKRPLALFFFPNPPVEETPKQSFRTLPDYAIDELPTKIRLLIRKAKAMQLNLSELYEGQNPIEKNILQDLSFPPQVKVELMASTIRDFLKVNLQEQTSWKDSDVAFKEWRNVLENCGIFVFKDAFHLEDYSGFCLYDNQFPIIYINNSKPKNRQIFTLFHELAHLLFQTGGIDTQIDNYIDFLDGDNRLIEILCNRFAGEFLVPTDYFLHKVGSQSINDNLIQSLSDHFNVSREVILRKALDNNFINSRFYNEKVDEWEQSRNDSKSKGRGDFYNNQGAYLGDKYIGEVFSKYYQNRISLEQLSDYLGVKVKNIPGMEQLLLNR